jgi:hypothetical protein
VKLIRARTKSAPLFLIRNSLTVVNAVGDDANVEIAFRGPLQLFLREVIEADLQTRDRSGRELEQRTTRAIKRRQSLFTGATCRRCGFHLDQTDSEAPHRAGQQSKQYQDRNILKKFLSCL